MLGKYEFLVVETFFFIINNKFLPVDNFYFANVSQIIILKI